MFSNVDMAREEALSFEVSLPLTRKMKAKQRKELLDRMRSFIEKNVDSLLIKDMKCEKYDIALETQELNALVRFTKPVDFSVMITKDVEKNQERINGLVNKLINYLNTILGDLAEKATVVMTKSLFLKEGSDVARKFIDEDKLVKINEVTRKTLRPKGIMFDYKSNNHIMLVVHLYDEDVGAAMFLLCRCVYTEQLPWDVFLEGYKKLKESIDTVKTLGQREL